MSIWSTNSFSRPCQSWRLAWCLPLSTSSKEVIELGKESVSDGTAMAVSSKILPWSFWGIFHGNTVNPLCRPATLSTQFGSPSNFNGLYNLDTTFSSHHPVRPSIPPRASSRRLLRSPLSRPVEEPGNLATYLWCVHCIVFSCWQNYRACRCFGEINSLILWNKHI